MEDAGEYISLKWSSFRSSLTEGFHDFLQEEAMVDVTLAAEGKFLQAHKLVLSVCSPYFKNLFKVNPCKHPIVFLKDVALSDLSYMLEFMYKGEVGVKHEDLSSFLYLADTLSIKGLAGEKIQKIENCSLNNLNSNVTKVGKKVDSDSVSEVNKENSEFQSSSVKKLKRSKRKKFPCRSEAVKKLKSEKCDDESANKCAEKHSDYMSEKESDNQLIKFVGGDCEKSGGSKQSVSQCYNENEAQCKNNKMNFSAWSDDIPDSNDSGGPDISSLFQSEYTEEAEQAPQELCSVEKIRKATRKSLIWEYFVKYPTSASCRLCLRNFKGFRPHASIEGHLKKQHPQQYLKFVRGREKQRIRLMKEQYEHLYSRFCDNNSHF